MLAFGIGGVEVGIEGAGGGVGIALNARNLYEAADGVTSTSTN